MTATCRKIIRGMSGIGVARVSLSLVALGFPSLSHARTIAVASPADLSAQLRIAQPGDDLLIADGTYRDVQLIIDAAGTADRPIRIAARTPGKVVLSGASNLRVGGRNLIISGLVFRDGASPTKEVIALRTDAGTAASNVRLTEIVIDHFNKANRRDEDIWVAIYGQDNRVDHSLFAGKGNAGVTLAVIRPKGRPEANRARIDHNYFGPRPPLGSNGGETIRIGTSEESLSDSATVIERNLFDRCDGEVEIISIKSGGNVVRENTILRSQGSIVLRHGNGNRVERNVILAGGKPFTGGIRIINRGQRVQDNYIEGSRGRDFTSAIAVMNGVPNSAIDRYHQVVDAVIARNSIIDPTRILFGVGNDAERTAAPVASSFEQNLIIANRDPIEANGDVSGIAMSGNVANFVAPSTGVASRRLPLSRAANGLLYADGIAAGAPRDLKPVTADEVGPRWYPKGQVGATFGSGKTRSVTPANLAVVAAKALPGDVLRLIAGDYRVDAPIEIRAPLTLTGPAAARVRFSAPVLFQLREGGALRLDGLTITGSGASVIRSDMSSTIAAYRVEIAGVTIRDLPGDVLTTTPSTLGESVTITRSHFSGIGGTVIAAAAETTKQGHYPIEQIEIRDSSFDRVGHVANVARLGVDESTFGPRFSFVNSTVIGGGAPAIRLSGVQNTRIAGNQFDHAGAIAISHSVGSPDTAIVDNRFVDTPAPVIGSLNPQVSPRIVLTNNLGL